MASIAADRSFVETSTFPAIGACSFSFAFALSVQTSDQGQRKTPRSTAFRLQALSRLLKGEAQGEAGATPHDLLVEPVRSFLDDVTNGMPGVNGRPLIFLASAAPADDPSRSLTLVRPPHWDYSYEGEITRLGVPPGSQRAAMWLRDSFCVFESGRIYYVLSLLHDPGEPLDEYAVIQFEQLMLRTENAEKASYLGFERRGSDEVLSLMELAEARLKELCEPKAAMSAIGGLMKPYGLLGEKEHLRPLSSSSLASLCIAVEDAALFKTAEYVHDKLDRNRSGRAPRCPKEVSDFDAAWQVRCASGGIDAALLHRQADNPIDRPLLAIAGIATGVPDFPYQDDSEVHDSTRLVARSVESALYSHPAFLLEIGKSWRSFREGADDIGTCPYLLMTWLVTVHDEDTIAEMERLLDDMIYDPFGEQASLGREKQARAMPLADVMQLLNSASSFFGEKTRAQEANLERRLELFRWESIHRCGNMFRYPKEKAALAAVRNERGIDARFDEVHATIDRLENLVEDVSSLASAYSARRTNRLLAVVAVLGLASLTGSLKQSHEAFNLVTAPYYGWISLAIAAALLLLYFSRMGRPRR